MFLIQYWFPHLFILWICTSNIFIFEHSRDLQCYKTIKKELKSLCDNCTSKIIIVYFCLINLFLVTLCKFQCFRIDDFKAWQKICVTFDSHQIWTVKWPHNYPIAGHFPALFLISPLRRSLSIWKISMRKGVMADVAEKSFILPKIGAKCFGIGIQDIYKVSVSYLEPFAGS